METERRTIVVKAEPVVLRISPLAFHYYATEYLEAVPLARTRAGERYSPVPYFLCCRAIELVLKAFLLTKGVSKKTLRARTVGHNLEVVLSMAHQHGLDAIVPLAPEEEQEVRKASSHYSTKEFEYFEVGHLVRRSQLPAFALLESAASKLVTGLRRVCLEAA